MVSVEKSNTIRACNDFESQLSINKNCNKSFDLLIFDLLKLNVHLFMLGKSFNLEISESGFKLVALRGHDSD